MLSDEERKAIDYLQLCYDLSTITNESLSKLGIVLNLIEKQSKEIEELNSDLEVFKRALTDIEVVYNKNYTSNDKIKAKIEEIDIEIQCCEYADDDTEEYKQDIEKEKRRLLRDKAVLQSLLEKE